MKNILIVVGHPAKESFCRHLAEGYRRVAEGLGAKVEVLPLSDLSFNPDLWGGLHDPSPLEPDLVRAQHAFTRADHLVFIYPNWWGTYPARFKGFIDRTFLPGFAFAYQKGSPFPLPLLKGKTARLITTMDGPGWWYRWMMGAGGDRAMIRSTLAFCGIKTLGVYRADSLRPRNQAPVDRHKLQMERLAKVDAGSLQRRVRIREDQRAPMAMT